MLYQIDSEWVSVPAPEDDDQVDLYDPLAADE